LQLARPANVVTAVADVAAGATVAGALVSPHALGLAVVSAALYAGGVVLNDVCDMTLDAIERPERPLPSGRADFDTARGLAFGLLVFGGLAAWGIGPASGILAMAIAALAVAYDTRAKHHALLGPLTMGACRGANLLLGVSAVPAALATWWPLALLPLAYVGAITAVSRGEVSGGRADAGWAAVGLAGLVALAIAALSSRGGPLSVMGALPFLALFGMRVLPAFHLAATRPHPLVVRRAVRAGVLSLIVIDAALAAAFGGVPAGLAVLALWPLSAVLARTFAVT
jgi:4-hydroxybenzoate polyprenyltransferase